MTNFYRRKPTTTIAGVSSDIRCEALGQVRRGSRWCRVGGSGPFGDAGQGFGDAVVDVVQFFGGDAVGRENVDYVAQRAKQNPSVEEKIVEPRAKGREISGIVGAQLDGSDGSDATHIADGGMIFDRGEALLMDLRNSGDALEDRFGLKDFEARDGRCGGDGISGVGMSVIKGAATIFADEGAMNFTGANGGGKRQHSSGNSF